MFFLLASIPRPLSRALQKVLVFRFFDPGPGGPGGPREAPQSYPWAFPGPPGSSRSPRAMDVTKPYNFIGFGAMDVTKPYKFIGFGAMDPLEPKIID